MHMVSNQTNIVHIVRRKIWVLVLGEHIGLPKICLGDTFLSKVLVRSVKEITPVVNLRMRFKLGNDSGLTRLESSGVPNIIVNDINCYCLRWGEFPHEKILSNRYSASLGSAKVQDLWYSHGLANFQTICSNP